jgi:arginase
MAPPTERQRIMTRISLLGIPHDDNSSFVKGAAQAPALIRHEMLSGITTHWSETGIHLGEPGRILDHGDIAFGPERDHWDVIEDRVSEAMTDGTPLLSLGGDHAITHPIMRGVRRHYPALTILHIDAHPDIYHAYEGNPRSHKSPFARIMEEKLTDRLIQVGLRTVNDHHRDQFRRFGVEAIEASRCAGPLAFDLKTPVYLSIDMDGLDPAFAPGVSHREPGGLSTRQVLDIIHGIDQPIVGADIVEYNPHYDIFGMTAIVAAKIAKEVAGMMLKAAPR